MRALSVQLVPISCARGSALVLGVAGCHHVHGVTGPWSTRLLEHPRSLARGKVGQQVGEDRWVKGASGAWQGTVGVLAIPGSVAQASVFLSYTHICFMQPIIWE